MALNAVCNKRLESREKLLVNLIRTIELLVDVCVFKQSVYVLCSGLNHIHTRVKSILRHGAKIRHHLIFAQPSFAAFDTWLDSKLADHRLGEELRDNWEQIQEFYYEWAFLHDKRLFRLFLDSLRVLATRDLDLLSTVMSDEVFQAVKAEPNEDLSAAVHGLQDGNNIGRTSSSLGDCQTDSLRPRNDTNDSSLVSNFPMETEVISEDSRLYPATTDDTEEDNTSNLSIPTFSYTLVSPSTSPPEFSQMSGGLKLDSNYDTSGSESSLPRDIRVSKVVATPRDPEMGSNHPEIETLSCSSTSNAPFLEKAQPLEITPTRKTPKSFLESGGFVQPPALGHFPLPQKGQSLTSFLSSLSDTLPDLDRENAHFNVSEAIISAFERLKSRGSCKDAEEHQKEGQLDEMEDMFGTVMPQPKPHDNHMHLPRLIPSETSSRRFYSGKHFPRPPVLHTETEESELEYWKQQPRRPPAHLKKKPRSDTDCITVLKSLKLSLKIGKLGSDGRSEGIASTTEVSSISSSQSSMEEDIASSSFSAENVALNLLRNARMKDEHLPPASELQWLVTDNETPQTLLPLPKNWTSASESESDYSGKTDCVGELDKSMRLRGTTDWAPPRPQIIFTIHPPPSLSILTDTQRYRCAGCGVRVDAKYACTFRYCFYLGRYFCTGCHTCKKARLPQMILHKWDFSPYMVSNFSATLLESLQSDPVYNVLAINPNLTRRVKLNNFRNYRIQLGFLHEYLKNCKAAERLYHEFQKFPTYYTADVDLFSLEDLITVRFSTGMPLLVKDFVSLAVHHVLHCSLCRNLGFVCELCKRNEILFPFQINRASRCPKCSSCFHLKCFNPTLSDCPKCLRLTSRRNTIEISPASIAV